MAQDVDEIRQLAAQLNGPPGSGSVANGLLRHLKTIGELAKDTDLSKFIL